MAPVQGGHGSVYAVLPDHCRLLRHQRLNRSLFEGLNLVRAGVEADDLDLLLLPGLAYAGGGAFCGEQVGGEDSNDVGVLLERRAHQVGRGGRIILGVLDAEVLEL